MAIEEFQELLYDAFIKNDEENNREANELLYELINTDIEMALEFCSITMCTIEVGSTMRDASIQLLINYIRHSEYECPPFGTVSPRIQELIARRCQNMSSDFVREIEQFIAQIFTDTNQHETPIFIWNKIITYIISTYARRYEITDVNLFTVIHISEMLKSQQQNRIGYEQIQPLLDKYFQGMLPMDKRNIIVQTLKEVITMISFDINDNDIIRNNVWTLLSSYLISGDLQLREIALLTITTFVELSTKHLSSYIRELYEKTIQLFDDIPEHSVPAIQIWVNLAKDIVKDDRVRSKEEDQQTKQLLCEIFTDKSSQFLVPLLRNLIVENEGPREDVQQFPLISRRKCSYKLIYLIQNMIGESSHKPILVFIDSMIIVQGAHHRKGACLAFQALAEGKPTEATRRILSANIIKVLKLVADEIHLVRTAASSALDVVAVNYSDILIVSTQSQEILTFLVNCLESQVSKLQSPVKVISSIAQQMSKFQESFIYQSKYELLRVLCYTAIRSDISLQYLIIIDYAFSAVYHIIQCIDDKTILKQYLNQLMLQLYKNFNLQGDQIIEQQSGISICLQSCLMRMDSADLSEQEILEIINVLESGKIQKCQQLYIISGLSNCLLQFTRYSNNILQLIAPALQHPSDSETFSAALLCISQVAQQMKTQFSPHKNILDFLTGIVLSPTTSRELKLKIYSTLSNILIALQEESFFYIGNFKKVLSQGISDCTYLSFKKEAQLIDYAEEWKECLIDFYLSAFHSFCTDEPHPDLSDTITQIFDFIKTVCDKKLRPTVAFCCSCVYAIFDIANMYYEEPIRKKIKAFIKSPFVADLLKVLNSNRSNEEFAESVSWACDVLKSRYNYDVAL